MFTRVKSILAVNYTAQRCLLRASRKASALLPSSSLPSRALTTTTASSKALPLVSEHDGRRERSFHRNNASYAAFGVSAAFALAALTSLAAENTDAQDESKPVSDDDADSVFARFDAESSDPAVEAAVRSLVADASYRDWQPEATEPTTGVTYPQHCRLHVDPDATAQMSLVGVGLRCVHLRIFGKISTLSSIL